MHCALKNRSLLSLDELSANDLHGLLEMARELKRQQHAGCEVPQLLDKHIARLADSMPTLGQDAFDAAAREQGAKVAHVGSGDAGWAAKGSVKDAARIFGRLYDAIEYRGHDRHIVDELAAHAGVPVWQGVTRPQHATQQLADCLTMREHVPDRPWAQLRVACLGDPRQAGGDALLQAAALLGVDLRVGAPAAMWPAPARIESLRQLAREAGASLHFEVSPEAAVDGVDFVCTDVWGTPEATATAWAERISQLAPYRVTAELMASSGNPAVKFLHGQPSLQALTERMRTALLDPLKTEALEVSDEVLASPASVLNEQAGNRLHAIKALLVATLA